MATKGEFRYLESLGLHLINPGLDRITKALNYLGDPQNSYNSILIAGTNGKGSVATILSTIFHHNCYNVGVYTSPHLINVNERISVNRTNISDDDLAFYINRVKNLCDDLNLYLSYFEFLTVIAFLYFYDLNVDIAVLEAGMGGRWDATNVVIPIISVITNISYDHTQYLGATLKKIAVEKSQIIKVNKPVVTACRGAPLKIIAKKSIECSSQLYIYENDFSIKNHNDKCMSYLGMNYNLNKFSSNLIADYQRSNIALSMAVIDIIKSKYNMIIYDENIRSAMLDVKWNGRFELYGSKNKLLIDCAHNESSAKALTSSIKKMYPGQKFYFLIGMLNDKKHAKFIKAIQDISLKIFITDSFSEREISPEKLGIICKDLGVPYKRLNNYKNALNILLNRYDPICITGSIYLVGSVLKVLNKYKIN